MIAPFYRSVILLKNQVQSKNILPSGNFALKSHLAVSGFELAGDGGGVAR